MARVTARTTVVVNNRILFQTLDGPVKRDVRERATRVRRAIAANAPKGRRRFGPRAGWHGDQDPKPRTRLSNPRSYFIGDVEASTVGPAWTVRVAANERTAPHAKWVIFGTGTQGRGGAPTRGAGGRFTGSAPRGAIVPRSEPLLIFPRDGGPGLRRKASVKGQSPNDYMTPAMRAAR